MGASPFPDEQSLSRVPTVAPADRTAAKYRGPRSSSVDDGDVISSADDKPISLLSRTTA